MSDKGFLILADITGYTAYLSKSELDHAQGTLGDLLTAMIDNTVPPQIISKLEGDAIFSYAPSGSFSTGHTMVESIENVYFAFRHALRRININTTCPCQACINIPSLDLKFFVHYGEYYIQKLGIQEELVGSDVNLAHRLMKNSVTEDTGLQAYALYTQAAIDALGISNHSDGMIKHAEEYEHLGEVATYIVDMHKVWEQDESRRRVAIDAEDALFVHEEELKFEAALVWQVITDPKYRVDVLGADSTTVSGLEDGRMGPGAVYHCAHGDIIFTHTVLDWNPFSYYTFESYEQDFEMKLAYTFHLTLLDKHTKLMMTLGMTGGNTAEVEKKFEQFEAGLIQRGELVMTNIKSVLARVTESGELVAVVTNLIGSEEIKQAAAASLAG
ncbi:MAG: DUF2652 domain-containing protein [Chloroflexota bacterium]